MRRKISGSVKQKASAARGYMPVSKTDDWSTPDSFYRALHAEFKFVLDAAASVENAKCERYFTREMDALTRNWGKGNVFCNPPYGRVLRDWMKKALDASRQGATVVMLVPARTGTQWFQEVAMPHGSEIRFLRGRLKFGGSEHPAPFDCILVVFRPEDSRKVGPRAAAVRVG